MKVSEIKWLDEKDPTIKEIKERFKMLFDSLVDDFNRVKDEITSAQEKEMEVPEEHIQGVKNNLIFSFMHYALGCESVLSGESEIAKKAQSLSLANKYTNEASK